ncbi:hypothetical protein [Streptomyces sp. 8L]|uniref:hypothetical protein n=1 Tax=Streptomyces sp. 8L TaxID=2877242 RepID=UPI001CD63354|nr:hypothetical protein [Streptomyces sp. 8L]MCA1223331.1 hypothetical protein [Streptomyces sp. 8L]
MPPRTSKALAAWTELNDRQQGTLAAIYHIEQGIEAGRRSSAARGHYDDTPAAVWRQIDFSHEPSDRRVFGWTTLQEQLALKGWDNQGNGSTTAALQKRGLITQDSRPTRFGFMRTVRLTREGRAAARAGTSLTTSTAKAALSARSWQVLAQLWAADRAGKNLPWTYSTTIERVLMDKHVPPLAELSADDAGRRVGGYSITERGRDFYREHHAAHAAAHPDVWAPHPDGEEAEPWPIKADQLLADHRAYYWALRKAWQRAADEHQAAQQESEEYEPTPPTVLPAEVREQEVARFELRRDTAKQRADLAGEHAAGLHSRACQAGRSYATASLAVFNAAVAGGDPLEGLQPPGEGDGWDEERLVPPSETGIHVIDAEARKLHAAAVGAPLKRRGPAPKHRVRGRRYSAPVQKVHAPGKDSGALADFLRDHTQDGVLLRRLHA